MNTYDSQTLNSPNPIARYAHRMRLKKSIDLALPELKKGKLLDYGCGAGAFVYEMNKLSQGSTIGYEPYMIERHKEDLSVFNAMTDIEGFGPYNVISLFETIEHLTKDEIDFFLDMCNRNLSPVGGILISAPIEVGPALILKELNRSFMRFKMPEHQFVEFLKASLFGIAARRAENIKTSHRGFDFRVAIAYLKKQGWNVSTMGYGPLPIAH